MSDHISDDELSLDTILPAQFFPPRVACRASERRLRRAILEDALRYYCADPATDDRRAEIFRADAADWIASRDRTEPFAFENVCEALGFDPDAVRRALRRWVESHPRPAAGAQRRAA